MNTTVTRFQLLCQVLDKISEDQEVRIFGTSHSLRAKYQTWGVNWSAKGTMNPEDAERYAKDIQAAASICRFVNGLQISVDPKLTDPLDDDEDASYIKLEELKGYLIDAVNLLDYRGVQEVLSITDQGGDISV